jgi:hypothetical protein
MFIIKLKKLLFCVFKGIKKVERYIPTILIYWKQEKFTSNKANFITAVTLCSQQLLFAVRR